MKKQSIYLVFTFLLLIPYLCSLTLIGICYNALVRHSSNIFRSLVGALVGAIICLQLRLRFNAHLIQYLTKYQIIYLNKFYVFIVFVDVNFYLSIIFSRFCSLLVCNGFSKEIFLIILYYWKFSWHCITYYANFNMYWCLHRI